MVYPALLPLMRTPRLPAVDWTDAHRRFKWTRPFRRKTKSGFCACAITFRTHYTNATDVLWGNQAHTPQTIVNVRLRRTHRVKFEGFVIGLAQISVLLRCEFVSLGWTAQDDLDWCTLLTQPHRLTSKNVCFFKLNLLQLLSSFRTK